MNCKQGDLAMIINGPSQGKLVECLQFIGHRSGWWCQTGERITTTDSWMVKILGDPVVSFDGRAWKECYVSDSRLRPIRGTPETVDERKEVEA